MLITLPIGLIARVSDLLADIAQMKPGFEIYDKAKLLTKDLLIEVEIWERQQLKSQVPHNLNVDSENKEQ